MNIPTGIYRRNRKSDEHEAKFLLMSTELKVETQLMVHSKKVQRIVYRTPYNYVKVKNNSGLSKSLERRCEDVGLASVLLFLVASCSFKLILDIHFRAVGSKPKGRTRTTLT